MSNLTTNIQTADMAVSYFPKPHEEVSGSVGIFAMLGHAVRIPKRPEWRTRMPASPSSQFGTRFQSAER